MAEVINSTSSCSSSSNQTGLNLLHRFITASC